MDYISIAEAAEKWGITRRRVQVLCSEGRIPGLEKLGKVWAIPKGRRETGRRKENKVRKIGHLLCDHDSNAAN